MSITAEEIKQGWADRRVKMLSGRTVKVRISALKPEKVAGFMAQKMSNQVARDLVEQFTDQSREAVLLMHPASYGEIFKVASGLVGMSRVVDEAQAELDRSTRNN